MPTLLARLQANMYLLYLEIRKSKKTGVVVQSVEPGKMTAKKRGGKLKHCIPCIV
jgi:hypothetical protein